MSKPSSNKALFANSVSVLDSIENRKMVGDSLFDSCKIHGEEALWRAVITQALMDAGSKSKKPEQKYHKYQAISWFSKKNKDFQTVCALAGLDIDYVFERAKKAIANECKWRNDSSSSEKAKVFYLNK